MMKRFITLVLSKLACLLCLFAFTASAQDGDLNTVAQEPVQQEGFDWSTLKKVWDDDIQFHGFFSQALFNTNGNNVYGNSKNSVSAGLTELGLNVSYQALQNLSFAAQGLYRRAGASTGEGGEATLDYAFFDYTFLNFNDGRMGLRGGRVKNPWGFYNETRDVASTHPTIFLPVVYFDRSRTLFLALDGGQVYADYNGSMGDLSFKLNFGLMNANDQELLTAITLDPGVSGYLKAEPSVVTQLNYELMGGQYAFAISYAHLDMSYTATSENPDPYAELEAGFDSFMLSAQYSGEKFSLVAEYNMQWNKFSGIPTPDGLIDTSPLSEYWYVQAGYRILDNLQTTIRYDSAVQDINDRSGRIFEQTYGLPAHLRYTRDVVAGLRWDITPSWMVRFDYTHVWGAAAVSVLDNDFTQVADEWDIYALQVAYRF